MKNDNVFDIEPNGTKFLPTLPVLHVIYNFHSQQRHSPSFG